jgi:ADP-heptose:LPS heptosyltransferase|tara:strand:+ start:210 stop:569 length:360 start_codon:yes stop_codon:yes gene_type:complete
MTQADIERIEELEVRGRRGNSAVVKWALKQATNDPYEQFDRFVDNEGNLPIFEHLRAFMHQIMTGQRNPAHFSLDMRQEMQKIIIAWMIMQEQKGEFEFAMQELFETKYYQHFSQQEEE